MLLFVEKKKLGKWRKPYVREKKQQQTEATCLTMSRIKLNLSRGMTVLLPLLCL